MTIIIDYGMGNLASVYNAFRKVGEEKVRISDKADDIRLADKLVLPGVGACEDAMRNLDKGGLIQPILDFAASGKPFLGICLGMQLLFEKSYENGVFDGLGILKGEVVRFDVDKKFNLPVPQMGWNQAKAVKREGVFDVLPENAYFYFDHAYYAEPKDKGIIAAVTEYGIEYGSCFVSGNVSAIQFHPEKSHSNGLKLIRRFSEM